MPVRRIALWHRKLPSLLTTIILIVNLITISISFQISNVSSSTVNHDYSNVEINMLTDFGRIISPIAWGSYQTTGDPSTGIGYIGLVIDQDNYDHTPGSENIADSFSSWPYASSDDLTTVSNITLVIDDGTTQKSIASFQNTGVGTGDANDILIKQTAWSIANKDWAIIQWTLNNLKATPLTGVCIGLELPLSQIGAGFGVGGDSGDDIDGFDMGNNTYWAQDDGGTTMGFGSAIVSDPITHYYSADYAVDYETEFKHFYENDTWLYDRIHAPNAVVGAIPGNRSTTVGWDGVTIGVGEARTFTLVIAANSSFGNMITAIKDAQYYYRTVLSGLLITEISDSGSGSAQIEVFNSGREPIDPTVTLSLSSNGGPLTGTWSVTPIPTYGYSVFTVNEVVEPEGDTITLYENGNSIDQVSYGQDGRAPDPLDTGSVARRWDSTTASYSNDWLGSISLGPTWGAQNDVPPINPSPYIILNEVMFNPIAPDGGYIVLINRPSSGFTIDVQNFRLACDNVYQIPFSASLNPGDRFIIRYNDDPLIQPLFNNMAAGGDNLYLYAPNWELWDMVGWTSPHTQGMSVRRVPDGNGTYQGYNDTTSEAAGWVFDSPLQVLMTEISDSESPMSQIEIYNPWYPPIDFSVGFAFESVSYGLLPGVWSTSIADAEDYAVFDLTSPNGLGHEGDTLSFFQNGILVEEISYGQNGVVPDPLSGESVERYWDGSEYTDVWERNWTSGPNFGARNDVPPANFSSWVLLNEILFNPVNPDDYFVELYLNYGSLDISGYRIVGDLDYIIPEGIILDSNNSFFYLLQSMDPAFFAYLDSSGDNIYLYDNNGSLLDMVGWSSLHDQGKSMCRVPDGNGTRDGFNDTSSIAAGWFFGCTPTPMPTPPAPPTGMQAKLVNNAKNVMLSWNASFDDGGGDNDVAGYTVYKSNMGVKGTYEFAAWIPANGSISYNWIDIDSGDGDWNDYFYIVRANDTSNNEEENNDKAGKFVNYLLKEWNLFSIPLIQTNTSKEFVLQTIDGNYSMIQAYHAGKSRPWLHWYKGKPKNLNHVIEINHKKGYYINMINPDYLVVAGKVPTNTQIPLKTGWNLVGYPCLINKTRDDALSSIAGKYNKVEYYDPIQGKEIRLGPDDFMKPGLGYWIHATEDCTLII